jgi:hypothetical protein
MSYGLVIRNVLNEVILDTTWPNFYLVNNSAYGASGFYVDQNTYDVDVPNWTDGDFIIIAPSTKSTCWIGRAWGALQVQYSWGVSFFFTNVEGGNSASTTNVHLLRQGGAQSEPTPGSYGLVCRDASGAITFKSTDLDSFATLITAGYFYPIGGTTLDSISTYYPSSTGTIADLSKHYVTLPSCTSAGFSDGYAMIGYEYVWTDVTNDIGRIRIVSGEKEPGSNVRTGFPFRYAIFKVVP